MRRNEIFPLNKIHIEQKKPNNKKRLEDEISLFDLRRAKKDGR